MDMRKISSPRNPLHKPINAAAVKHDIFLFRIFTSLFHSMSHTTNRGFFISLVTPKPIHQLILHSRSEERRVGLTGVLNR